MVHSTPRYLHSHIRLHLKAKADAAMAMLTDCALCPRQCHVDRTSGETGFCRTGDKAVVASYNAHFGEESPLVGQNGSGTIFFTHCNLMCNFCQNYDISSEGAGIEVDAQQLAEMMLDLQRRGCHNVNLVTPTHVMPQILSALAIAAEKGLNLPLVYNTSGYDDVASLAMLDGIIDIYMPDMKFFDADIAERTCDAADYGKVVQAAVLEMHRQVGDLAIDDRGIAYEGLLVRHLVMPEGVADTSGIMAFIASHVSPATYVNIMPQYRPCGKASQTPPLNRSITKAEFEAALHQARKAGINRLDSRRSTFLSW